MTHLDYIKYLKDIKKLLEKEGMKLINLDLAISSIQDNKDLKYEIKPIKIEMKGKFPKRLSHTNVDVLELEFDLNIDGKFADALNGKDPFSSYTLNIVVYGLDGSGENLLYNAMHLDKHDGTISNTIHPYYHFQFGGNKLKENINEYGQVLILDSPRIMYHPMEFILAIDFIVSNFLPNAWKNLKKNPTYLDILNEIQKLIVQPYFRSITNFFDKNVGNWNHLEVYPQFYR